MATAVGGFQTVTLENFSLGSVQSVARNLIPDGGVYEIRNGLLQLEGTISLRAGASYYSNANGPDAGGVRFLWAGNLSMGTRVVAGTDAHLFVLNGTTPVTVSTQTPGYPVRASEIGGFLFMDNGRLYAGSLKTADYSTGTVTVTSGLNTVTGSGTTWTGNVDPGMLFHVGTGRYYYVTSVTSNTQLTLNESWVGSTASGQSYTLTPAAAGPFAQHYAAVAGKLLYATDNRVTESAPPNDLGIAQPFTIPANNFVELPDGSNVTGLIGLRGNALIFGTNGVWLLQNVALDLVDASGNPQQRLDQVSAELKLWGSAGLASWSNRVVAPCTDDIYLMDGVSAPEPISRSITPKYRSYVQAGYKPGLASVFANHYILPILDSSDVEKDCLVCRLDRPVRTSIGVVFPWSFMDGASANITSVTVLNSGAGAPVLLAGSKASTARVLKLGWFEPSVGTIADQDGTNPALDVTFADISTGGRLKTRNHVKFMRLNYELITSGAASIQAFVGDERRSDQNIFNQLANEAPATASADQFEPYAWLVNQSVHYFRPRFKSSGAGSSAVIRGLELEIIRSFG